jgi:hypothetical protein
MIFAIKIADSSGTTVVMEIPDPSSKPAIVVTRGRIWICQR